MLVGAIINRPPDCASNPDFRRKYICFIAAAMVICLQITRAVNDRPYLYLITGIFELQETVLSFFWAKL